MQRIGPGRFLRSFSSVVLALLAIVLLAAVFLGACGDASERPKNLLLLSVDTLRADALGFAGYSAARTPNLDRLAAEGTILTNAVTTMPRTTPALGSLLTGLWPHRHGSREVGEAIVDVPTLAEILDRHGYTTLAVSANSTAGPKQELHRGFDRFVTYEDLVATYDKSLYRDLTDVSPDQPGWATAVTEEGLRLASQVDPDEPYFLWLFYFDPHLLYRPPAPWQGVEAERCWALYDYYLGHQGEAGQVFSDIGGVASEALEDCRRLYDAEIAYVDQEIGRLLDELEATGRREETLIVFTADHGENFGEGGLFFEHGDNVHGAGLDVPLVFQGPGIARGKRDGRLVSLVDVVPTVLSLLRVAPGPALEVDGIDLSPRLSGDEMAVSRQRIVFAESATSMWNEAFDLVTTGHAWGRVCINGERFTLCEWPGEEPGVFRLYDHEADPGLNLDLASSHPETVAELLDAWRHWPPGSARQRTARTERFKLVQTPRLDGTYKTRLYDLAEDPGETVDISDEQPEITRHLRERLETWGEGIPEPAEREYDPELEEQLRSLGYLK